MYNAAMRRRLDKVFRLYWWPFIVFTSTFGIGIVVFSYYFYPSKILGQEALLQVEAIIIILAAFTGIIIPLQITRNQKKERERRVMAFSMGMIWTELRKNKFVIEQVEVSYRFNRLFALTNFDDLIKILLGK